MKTLERLILYLLKLEVRQAESPAVCIQTVNDAVLYMLHRALSHLEEPGAYVTRVIITASD